MMNVDKGLDVLKSTRNLLACELSSSSKLCLIRYMNTYTYGQVENIKSWPCYMKTPDGIILEAFREYIGGGAMHKQI